MHKALGRGLDSLLSSSNPAPAQGKSAGDRLPIDSIKPNRFQPRTCFDEDKLKELAESIRRHGLAQPLLVAPGAAQGEYELIAGERRWRASRMAGLTEVPVVIRQADDKERFQLALIENIQRENLNPIEEAKAYRRLADEFGLTQEALAQAMGKDRSVIANSLRLLNLPQEVQDAVEQGRISAGHGRILAGLDDAEKQRALTDRIISDKLTVRETEKIVADWKTVLADKAGKAKPADAELLRLAEELQRIIGTKITISGKVKKGRIEIHYFSLDELERISSALRTRQYGEPA